MTKLQQYTYVCAPSALQYAALKAMDVPMKQAVDAYRRKRDIAFTDAEQEVRSRPARAARSTSSPRPPPGSVAAISSPRRSRTTS